MLILATLTLAHAGDLDETWTGWAPVWLDSASPEGPAHELDDMDFEHGSVGSVPPPQPTPVPDDEDFRDPNLASLPPPTPTAVADDDDFREHNLSNSPPPKPTPVPEDDDGLTDILDHDCETELGAVWLGLDADPKATAPDADWLEAPEVTGSLALLSLDTTTKDTCSELTLTVSSDGHADAFAGVTLVVEQGDAVGAWSFAWPALTEADTVSASFDLGCVDKGDSHAIWAVPFGVGRDGTAAVGELHGVVLID